MKYKIIIILMIVGLLITAFGLLTGKFYFLFLLIPNGFGIFKKKEPGDNESNN